MDPLHLYVDLVSLCSFDKSNAYTLLRIFKVDMLAADWQQAHKNKPMRWFMRSWRAQEKA
jgi:hypothetical protein